jgi:predicted ATPase with chaperone activity
MMTVCVDAPADWRVHPQAPRSLEESGVTLDLIVQLVVKTLHLSGDLVGADLAHRLGLTFAVIEPALDLLIAQHQVEIVGGAMVGRAAYRFRITDAGRTRAQLFLRDNQYVGVAPVPINVYRAYMRGFGTTANNKTTQARIRQAFSHLVISDRVLDQLGPAINARHSLFVYGPPGNGKTVISQAIRNVMGGEIAIPHALEVDGTIIRVFDPVLHEPVSTTPDARSLDAGDRLDGRWVTCRRPMITVGGELRLDALELSDTSGTGFSRAPLQLAANAGVLVIDDFGRQQCSPRELLNRWIVPLESRVDFLSLASGQKVDLPFMVFVVFATNLQPSDLVDDAFLRRIQYKVFAQGPSPEEFLAIFENCCRDEGISYNRAIVEHLLNNWYRPHSVPLRGCHPRDLIRHALALAEYLDQPRLLTTDLLDAACDGYFIREEKSVDRD